MKSDSKIIALLATARIANVPSVLSNLGVGVLLGSIQNGASFQWPWLLSLAAILFYICGNFFNDWADRDWDRIHRPERALPQGMFSANSYLAAAVIGTITGLFLAALNGFGAFLMALVLVSFIVQYTKVHKTAAWSVIPMGLCRACLPLLGYVAMRGGLAGPVIFPSLALLIYIIALSLSARWEAKGDMPAEKRWRSKSLLYAAGMIAAVLPVLTYPMLGFIGLLPFFVWLRLCLSKFQSPVSVHVSALLAGIPLVDWVTLLPMGLIWLKLERTSVMDPMSLTAFLLAPVCFVSGRVLQRLASAT
ncbi:UbiA family prenyltransferase [Luteolibacter algae]|uniref:UbiA family prenyltransferase n=1 Tax=Luteolibacter algae TaxID=454151 RepID=A0ABW5D7F6_9BACT